MKIIIFKGEVLVLGSVDGLEKITFTLAAARGGRSMGRSRAKVDVLAFWLKDVFPCPL